MKNYVIFIVLFIFFGMIARLIDYIVYSCEYKCVSWFFLGVIMMLVFNKIKK